MKPLKESDDPFEIIDFQFSMAVCTNHFAPTVLSIHTHSGLLL